MTNRHAAKTKKNTGGLSAFPLSFVPELLSVMLEKDVILTKDKKIKR
jgi:hypothetical protein